MNRSKTLGFALLVFAISLLTFKVVSSAGVVPWFQISDTPALQSLPEVAYNAASHQFLVVWEDFRGPGIGDDVYAQLVNDDGTLSGGNFPISQAADWQRSPKPAHNPDTNQYLVVWEEWRNATDDIYGQLVNANGALSGTEFVVSSAAQDQSNPDLVYNTASDQFLVVFDDDRLVVGDYDIYGKFINGNGSLAGADFPISESADNQLLPVIAYNTRDDQFLVVWRDSRNPATSDDIYARMMNGDGSMAGPEFAVSTASADQTAPEVAYDSFSNQFLVVWQHSVDIYGRVVNADGSMDAPEFQIASSSGSLSDPAVGFDSQSRQFLVAWSDSEGWDNIYAQLVDTDGSLSGSQIDLATGKGDFFYPEMAFDSSANRFLVVWRHQICHSFLGCDDNDIDIFGALYGAAAHYGVSLPLIVRRHSPQQAPTSTNTPVTPEASPTQTSTPTPTSTSTPTPTPTQTPGAWLTILSEDFEGSFPGAWTLIDGQAGFGEYFWGRRNCRAYSGNYSGWAVGGGADGGSLACQSNYPNNAKSWMIYGPFSLSDATAAELHLKAWVNTESPTEMFDYLCWFASTDGNNFAGDCTWGNSGGWVDEVLDLSNVTDLGDLTGEPAVWVGLYFSSDASVTYAEGAYVDDILLRKCTDASCSEASLNRGRAEPAGLRLVPMVKTVEFP
jgi:hypothetical protein